MMVSEDFGLTIVEPLPDDLFAEGAAKPPLSKPRKMLEVLFDDNCLRYFLTNETGEAYESDKVPIAGGEAKVRALLDHVAYILDDTAASVQPPGSGARSRVCRE